MYTSAEEFINITMIMCYEIICCVNGSSMLSNTHFKIIGIFKKILLH